MMKKSSSLWAGLALLLALLSASPAVWSHQQKAALTEILFNERSGSLEVVHRFYLHDAEHAIRDVVDANADIIGSPESQRRFAEYVQSNFAIIDESGRSLELRPVGYEADGNFFWVYQEISLPEDMDTMTVINNSLREIWPSQINTVNIKKEGQVISLTFRDQVEQLQAQLP